MKSFFIELISFYQRRISPLSKAKCVFYPTCSEYAKQAISKYGVLKGFQLSFVRILKCHPWQGPKIDLLP